MTIIYLISAIFLIIVITFTWHTLEALETKEKILAIVIGIIVSLIITIILFNISSAKVEYHNKEMLEKVRIVSIIVFLPINAIMIMPYLGKQISKYRLNEIEKNKFVNRIIIFFAIIFVIFIIENNYLVSIQNGIMDIVTGLLNNK